MSIVMDIMFTGNDTPPLHTLYLDRPMRGALLMQTLARVNRTFRGKSAGLRVAYAPIAGSLADALAEYTADDQGAKPVGKEVADAAEVARELVAQLREVLQGSGCRERLEAGRGSPRGWVDAVMATLNWLRSPHTPGNVPAEGEESRESRFRRLA